MTKTMNLIEEIMETYKDKVMFAMHKAGRALPKSITKTLGLSKLLVRAGPEYGLGSGSATSSGRRARTREGPLLVAPNQFVPDVYMNEGPEKSLSGTPILVDKESEAGGILHSVRYLFCNPLRRRGFLLGGRKLLFQPLNSETRGVHHLEERLNLFLPEVLQSLRPKDRCVSIILVENLLEIRPDKSEGPLPATAFFTPRASLPPDPKAFTSLRFVKLWSRPKAATVKETAFGSSYTPPGLWVKNELPRPRRESKGTLVAWHSRRSEIPSVCAKSQAAQLVGRHCQTDGHKSSLLLPRVDLPWVGVARRRDGRACLTQHCSDVSGRLTFSTTLAEMFSTSSIYWKGECTGNRTVIRGGGASFEVGSLRDKRPCRRVHPSYRVTAWRLTRIPGVFARAKPIGVKKVFTLDHSSSTSLCPRLKGLLDSEITPAYQAVSNSSKMTSPTPSVNYSGSATGINAEFDFDSEMPSSRQPEPKSPSIQEFEQPNSEEHKPKRAKSTTSDVWKSFTKIGMVDGKEKARCNGCQKEYIIGGIKYGTSSLLRHIPKCVALPKYHNVGTMMLDAMLAYCYWLLA
nr:zinc finger BED domain-containing protein RICESLEEPER 2-like [Ipomoea batatas]